MTVSRWRIPEKLQLCIIATLTGFIAGVIARSARACIQMHITQRGDFDISAIGCNVNSSTPNLAASLPEYGYGTTGPKTKQFVLLKMEYKRLRRAYRLYDGSEISGAFGEFNVGSTVNICRYSVEGFWGYGVSKLRGCCHRQIFSALIGETIHRILKRF